MKRIQIIFFMIIIIFTTSILYGNPKKKKNRYVIKRGTPSFIVAQLYSIYKNKNFRRALSITTGIEKEKVMEVLKRMQNNFGRPPMHVSNFIAKIDELRILSETVVKDKLAKVDVIWVLKIRDKDNRRKYQLKVNEVAYLLKKINNKWYIKSSKFLKQHIFYNYYEIQQIYKKALPFHKKKRRGK